MQIENIYKNDHACASFVNFIALDQLEFLKTQLREFNIQSDASTNAASTNAANKECELFMVQYLDCKATDGQLHIRDRFFGSEIFRQWYR